jgi:hypothetical protein
MAVSKQIRGMQGVYLVAAELSRRGFVVATTSRSAKGADLLVTDEDCQSPFTVQVKTTTTGSTYWLVGKEATLHPTSSHLFVFVELPEDTLAGASFFVVPSHDVAAQTCIETFGGQEWYSYERDKAEKYRDRWDFFGPGRTTT